MGIVWLWLLAKTYSLSKGKKSFTL